MKKNKSIILKNFKHNKFIHYTLKTEHCKIGIFKDISSVCGCTKALNDGSLVPTRFMQFLIKTRPMHTSAYVILNSWLEAGREGIKESNSPLKDISTSWFSLWF